MKLKLLFLAAFSLVVLLSISCSSKHGNDSLPSDVVDNPASADGSNGDQSQMSFETVEHDFGDIMQGEKVEFNYKFTNTGKSDLVITSHSTSCGCTVPAYPKGAIAPSEGGVITVAFNSSGKKGRQNKTVTLSTNGQPRDVVLTVKANIIEP
jgi:hypothetical protein